MKETNKHPCFVTILFLTYGGMNLVLSLSTVLAVYLLQMSHFITSMLMISTIKEYLDLFNFTASKVIMFYPSFYYYGVSH